MTYPLIFLISLSILVGCAPARQPIAPGVIPPPRPSTVADEQYGHAVLNELSQRWQIDYNDSRLNQVTSVIDRLTKAAGADKGPWHIYLLKDPKFKNAAATRGNHVFIWTGMLNVTKTEEELATVLAHELSHVLAGHTDPDPNEQLKKILINVGSLAAGIAVAQAAKNPTLGQNLGNLTSSLTQQVGSGFFVYPYSRELEYEADRVGLMLMAQAGYNPETAIQFWQKTSNDPDFSATIQFFSTHPPAKDRLQKLEAILPLALDRYHQVPHGTPQKPVAQHRPPSADVSCRDSSDPKCQPPLSRDPAHAGFGSGRTNSEGQDLYFADKGRSRWRVYAQKAILYSGPSIDSKPLGELKRGTIVEVISQRRGWLEIDAPDHGFLQGKDLDPEVKLK